MTLRIATHNGPFHCDDVFAVAILSLIHGEVSVIRTRNPADFTDCDIVLDVGGQYDGKKFFDHHQGGLEVRENEIPYAACGLIWKHFGRQLCEEDVWQKIEDKLVCPIDADDNGVDTFTVEKIAPYTLPTVIMSFKPSWNEAGSFDTAFLEAVEFAKKLLVRELKQAKAKLLATQMVKEELAKQTGKPYLVLDQYIPWHNGVEDCDKLYVIYPASSGMWMAQCVQKEKNSFANKKDFPKEWGGLTGKDLQEKIGVSEAEFCHHALYLCGAKTKEAMIQMVEMALQN